MFVLLKRTGCRFRFLFGLSLGVVIKPGLFLIVMGCDLSAYSIWSTKKLFPDYLPVWKLPTYTKLIYIYFSC